MGKNHVQPDRPQMTIRGLHIACWTPKAKHTHTQNMLYLLLFHCNNGYTTAPLFRYTNIACLAFHVITQHTGCLTLKWHLFLVLMCMVYLLVHIFA